MARIFSARRLAVIPVILLAAGLLFLPACAPAGRTVDLHGYARAGGVTDTIAIVTDQDQEAIIIQLLPEKAPLTAANFQKLVGEGFYNGLTFHRVVVGVLIQGGDPNGDGSGGPGYTITGEFSVNGISNDLNHERGMVSMARSDDYDSAGSQFFICQSAIKSLDRKYAVFGQVLAGMTVVDRIASVANSGSPNNRPDRRQIMKEVFFVEPDAQATQSSAD